MTQLGFDVNGIVYQDLRGIPTVALYLACKYDNIDIIDILLLYGSNKNVLGSGSRMTPLQSALERNNIDIVIRLLYPTENNDTVADPNTGIFYCKSVTALRHLILTGANLNSTDYEGKKFVDILFRSLNPNVELLKEALVHTDTAAKNKIGRNTLHNYLLKCRTFIDWKNIILTILNSGANINTVSYFDGTPLMIFLKRLASETHIIERDHVLENDYLEILMFLMGQGADPLITNKDHQNSFDIIIANRVAYENKNINRYQLFGILSN